MSRTWIEVVLDDGIHRMAIGQVAANRGEGVAAIGALEQVRGEITPLPVVERHEHGVGVARRREHVGHVGPVGHAGELGHPAVAVAAVLGDLQQAVVGADVQQPLDQRRLIERDDVG
jgi:hypothetical protein